MSLNDASGIACITTSKTLPTRPHGVTRGSSLSAIRSARWSCSSISSATTRPAPSCWRSIPSSSSLAAVGRLATRHPIAFGESLQLLRLRPLTTTRALVRDLFFTPQTPEHMIEDCHARLQDESFPAFLDSILVRARPRRIRTPVIVLAAGRDAIFTVDEMHRTAHTYGRPAEVFDGIGHDMMLDVGWQRVTDRIAEWAAALGPRP